MMIRSPERMRSQRLGTSSRTPAAFTSIGTMASVKLQDESIISHNTSSTVDMDISTVSFCLSVDDNDRTGNSHHKERGYRSVPDFGGCHGGGGGGDESMSDFSTSNRDFSAPLTSSSSMVSVAAVAKSIVTVDEAPYLYSQLRLLPNFMKESLPQLDLAEIRVNELLREGEISRTYQVSRCPLDREDEEAASTSPRKSIMRRTISAKKGYSSHRMSTSTLPEKSTNSLASSSPKKKDEGDQDTPLQQPVVERRKSTWKTGKSMFSVRKPKSQYSIKCLAPDHSSSQAHHRILMRETLYLSVLEHPNILQLRGCPNPSGSSVFAVTTRIAETLQDRMSLWKNASLEGKDQQQKNNSRRKSKKNTVDVVPPDLVALATNYALQIAHALEYLHNRGMVIRNLRPDTIGILEYPNHHTLQLMDLTEVSELDYDDDVGQPSLPSTEAVDDGGMMMIVLEEEETDFADDIDDVNYVSGGHMRNTPPSRSLSSAALSTSHHNLPMRRMGSHDSGPPLRRNGSTDSAPLTRNGSTESAPLRRNGSTESAPLRRNGSTETASSSGSRRRSRRGSIFGKKKDKARLGDSSASANPLRRTVSTETAASSTSRISAKSNASSGSSEMDESGRGKRKNGGEPVRNWTRCAPYQYRAPELYKDLARPDRRYNAKADVYSWAIIYFEMLSVDKRAFPAAVNVSEHLGRVRTEELRPSLQKCYFPLSVKEVLQSAWLPIVSRRADSTQLVKSLTLILHVLEGKGLARQRRPTSASTRRGISTATVNPAFALPERAAALLVGNQLENIEDYSSTHGWDQVWNPNHQTSEAEAMAQKSRVKMHTAMLNNPTMAKHLHRRHKEEGSSSNFVFLF